MLISILHVVCDVPVAGLITGLHQSNTAGKAIVVFLFCGSILAWTLMLTKFKTLRMGACMTEGFLGAYRKEGNPAALFLKRKRYDPSPVYVIYVSACRALGSEVESRGADPDDLFMGAVGASRHHLTPLNISAVRNVAERSLADQALLMENQMGLVATAASAAPFLGLLGTVWGVMEAFQGMAQTGSAMLSAVAPGISGALLTTVVGLLVALPSAVGYNLLSDMIRRISVEMDNFVQELISDIERCYQEQD